MGIRKSDLQKFIDEKSRKRKDDIREQARLVVKSTLGPIIFETFSDVEPIEQQAQLFHDSLLLMKEKHARFQKWWNLNSVISDVNSYIIGLRADIVRDQTGSVLSNLLDRATNGVMKEVEQSIPILKKQLAKQISEYQDIVKLTEEISSIISSNHNGDKAYKRLEELGVDLSDFKFGNTNLPAIIKLSANVCVLNGNC
jgi:hypothetical protein